LSASLHDLRSPEASLAARCVRASIARQLFDARSEVEVAGTRFTIQRRLGAGAMGAVYETERSGRSGRYALKVLHEAGSEYAYRLKREFRTLSRLGHPNLVVLHELFADADGAAFSMELLRGTDFLSYVRPHGAVELPRLRRVVAQLAEGLAALHTEGVVHRDLKPSNVLVDGNERAVLLDFGVALVGPEHDVSGTRGFMAPEQRLGQTTPASDLFALGVMMQLALEGSHAESGSSPELARLRALSERLCDSRALARPTPLELVRELNQSPRAHSVPRASIPFIGRAGELTRLTAFATEPRRAIGLAYVHGPAGYGKSALIAELTRRLGRVSAHTLVLSGRCCRRETVRYRALDPLMDALSDALLHGGPERTRDLHACASSDLLDLFPVLARVPALRPRARVAAPLADPRERRAVAMNALRQLLHRVCRVQPVLMCIDDGHWLDEESFELIRDLLQGPDAPPVRWLLAARPHDVDRCGRLAAALAPPDVWLVPLAELEAGDALALARSLFPEQEELWTYTSSLPDRSPFMLTQLGQVSREAPAGVPMRTLEHAIQERVEGLPGLPRQLLRLVSLSAAPASLELLCLAGGVQRAEAESALHLLEAQRWVQPVAGDAIRVEPYHDKIAEIVSQAISPALRSEAHRDLASALEQAMDAADPRALLFHYRHAGESQKALRLAELEAGRAEQRLSFHEAAGLFAECEALTSDALERSRFVRARADALVNAGRDREAAQILRALSENTPDDGERYVLAGSAAQLYFRAGHRAEAILLLAPWLQRHGLRPCATRTGCVASFLVHRARLLLPVTRVRRDAGQVARVELCELVARGFSRMQVLDALDYASRLAWLVRRGATEPQRIQALLFDALVHALIAPKSARAEALLARAHTLCESAADPVLLARWSLTVAQCAGFRIDRNVVIENARRAVRLFEAHGRGVQMELGEARWLALLAEFGRGQRVVSELSPLIRDAAQRGDKHTEANGRICLAVGLLADDEALGARTQVELALACREAGPREAIHWIGQASQARVDLYEGHWGRAYERLRRALGAMARHGYGLVPWIRIELRYLFALAALRAHGRRARHDVRVIARRLAAEQLLWPALLARQLQSALLALEGDRERAAAQLTAVADDFVQAGGAWYAWGSLLLAHRVSGDEANGERLVVSLRARGTPEPRRFLTSYAPGLET
jgi:serine/threonine protein kinase